MTSFMHNSLARESNALWVLARAIFTLRSLGRALALALLFFVLPALLQATPIRVIEEAAIPFAGFLYKVDFDQRYPPDL